MDTTLHDRTQVATSFGRSPRSVVQHLLHTAPASSSLITAQAPAAVAEHIGPTIGVVVIRIDDAICEIVADSNALNEIAIWIGLLGAEFTVHEPPGLRLHVAALGERARPPMSRGDLDAMACDTPITQPYRQDRAAGALPSPSR